MVVAAGGAAVLVVVAAAVMDLQVEAWVSFLVATGEGYRSEDRSQHNQSRMDKVMIHWNQCHRGYQLMTHHRHISQTVGE